VPGGGGVTPLDIIYGATLGKLLVLGPQRVAELAAAFAVWNAAVSASRVAHPVAFVARWRAALSVGAVRFEARRCSRLRVDGYSVPAVEGVAERTRQRALEIASEALEALNSGDERRAFHLLGEEVEWIRSVAYMLLRHPLGEQVELSYKKHLNGLYSGAAELLRGTVLAAARARAASEVLTALSEVK